MLPRLAIIAVAMWPLLPSANGQPQAGELTSPHAQRGKDSAPPAPAEGLWPSQRLVNLMLVRWAERVSHKYELDDVQRAKVREVVTKRWSGFLTQNRSSIQPIVNELIEMRLELQPPTKDRVQAWAERAMPLLEKVREQFDQGTAEFRKVLTPLQRVEFEVDALKIGIGMKLAEQKLQQWKKGKYEQGDLWEPPSAQRRRRRSERRDAGPPAADFGTRGSQPDRTGAAGSLPAGASTTPPPDQTDQIALELQAWDRYVEEFIRIYALDEGQRDAVRSVLSELKDRAIAHRDRRRDDMADLEQRIETFTGNDDELADLKQQLTELYGPIDDMFQELKHRIEQIPTQKQRAKVAQNSE